MLYANRIDFPDTTLMAVGSSFNGRQVTKIEVYHDEYEDHSEMTLIPYCGDDQLGKVWNMPCRVSYVLADKQEEK